MRGRLIQKFYCTLHKMDTEATRDVAGGGFDDEFGSVKPVPDGSQTGSSSRREQASITIPCQVGRRFWGLIEMFMSGKDITTNIVLTCHMRDLENLGLRTAAGKVLISSQDRIEQILDKAGNVQWEFPYPSGLYITAVTPAGHGLNMAGTPKFNLCKLTCKPQRMGR